MRIFEVATTSQTKQWNVDSDNGKALGTITHYKRDYCLSIIGKAPQWFPTFEAATEAAKTWNS